MTYKVFPTPPDIVKNIYHLYNSARWFNFNREFWTVTVGGFCYNGPASREQAERAGEELTKSGSGYVALPPLIMIAIST